MRILILLIFYIFLNMPNEVNAYTITQVEPLSPSYNNFGYNPISSYNNNNLLNINESSNYPKISLIEKSLFNRTYENNDIYNRLSRLENRIFKRDYPNVALAQRVDNILNNVDSGCFYPNISKNVLSQLEVKYLGKSYPKLPIEQRILGLEQKVFGSYQSGNLGNRYNTLVTAANNSNIIGYNNSNVLNNYGTGSSIYGQNIMNNGFNPYYNQIGTPPIIRNGNIPFINNTGSTGGITGFLKNMLGSIISGGTMTGFTPQIYDPYLQQSPSQYGTQSNFSSNNYSYTNNYGTGNGAGVKVFY